MTTSQNELGALSFRFVSSFSLSQEQIAEMVRKHPALAGKKALSIVMEDGNRYVN